MKKVFLIALLLVCACSQEDKRNLLENNKKVFNAVDMYSHSKLSLPPLYYLTSAEIVNERKILSQHNMNIRDIIFGISAISTNPNTHNVNFTSGDIKLLELTNANGDLSDVREKIDRETLSIQAKEDSFIRKLFSNYEGEVLDDKLSEYKKYNN